MRLIPLHRQIVIDHIIQRIYDRCKNAPNEKNIVRIPQISINIKQNS